MKSYVIKANMIESDNPRINPKMRGSKDISRRHEKITILLRAPYSHRSRDFDKYSTKRLRSCSPGQFREFN